MVYFIANTPENRGNIPSSKEWNSFSLVISLRSTFGRDSRLKKDWSTTILSLRWEYLTIYLMQWSGDQRDFSTVSVCPAPGHWVLNVDRQAASFQDGDSEPDVYHSWGVVLDAVCHEFFDSFGLPMASRVRINRLPSFSETADSKWNEFTVSVVEVETWPFDAFALTTTHREQVYRQPSFYNMATCRYCYL